MIRRLAFAGIAAVMLTAQAEPPSRPDAPLADAAQEARAQALFDDIRCVVCQHEAISDSPAGVAADMRAWVRDRVAEGRTDAEIRDELIRRYGDYVLFEPPFRAGTLMLWLGPFLIAAGALAGLLVWARRRRAAEPAPLSREEEARLAEITRAASRRPDPDATSPHDGH
ncbi:MAG: cytochrome c-type biogenesis protein [Brevundimonas sp.]